MPAVEMNAVNPFLKNKYADLGAIIKATRPILAKHGLALVQLPVSNDGEIGLKTILMHESGEFVEDTIFLPIGEERGKSVAQVAGSIITYLRRYSWSAFLGIYADEDSDGNQPQTSQKKEPTKKVPAPKQTGNIFDTVTTKEGVPYNELDIPSLANTINGIEKYLKDNPDIEQGRRDEYELKRDAAKHFIEQKKG